MKIYLKKLLLNLMYSPFSHPWTSRNDLPEGFCVLNHLLMQKKTASMTFMFHFHFGVSFVLIEMYTLPLQKKLSML